MHLGGFGLAAQKLHATQPAISARIKELERVIGKPLFERSSRGPRPSASARALFPIASEILAGAARIESEISDNEIVSGTIRIGIGEIVALTWFPAFLSRLNNAYPSVQLDIHMDVSNVLLPMLEDGRIDLAFVTSAGAPNLYSESLGSIPLRWMASKSLVLTSDDLSPKELAALPIYALHRDSHLHAKTMKWFRRHGQRPTLVHNCNSLSVIIKIVEMGSGIALIPPILVNRELKRGSLLIIAPPNADLSTEFFLVRHPEIIDPTILRICDIAAQTTVFQGGSVVNQNSPDDHRSDGKITRI